MKKSHFAHLPLPQKVWGLLSMLLLAALAPTFLHAQAPSSILPDLQYFKVTFPIDANGNDNRNVSYSDRSSSYVKATEEDNLVGYTPSGDFASYFFVAGNEVVFRAHCAGALTSANAYPRTELRETPNGTNDLWLFADEHVLNSTFRVTALPDQKQEVCMLQIKGNSSNNTSGTQEAFRLEYRQDGSQGLHVVINEGSTVNNIMGYSLGQALETRMYVNNGRVYIDLKNLSTGETWSEDFNSNYSHGYFKAGCYTQSSIWEEKNGVAPEDPDSYGEVRFSQLSMSDGGNPPPPTCSATVPSNRSASNVGSSSVTLSWDAVANIDHYNVRYRPVGATTWLKKTSLQTNSISISDLSENTTYEWQVRAKCADNTGSSYNAGAGPAFTTSTSNSCNVSTPSNRSAGSIGNSSVVLSWSNIANIDHYNVRYRPVGSSDWSYKYSLQTNNVSISGLSSGTTYEWQVRAKCPDGSASSYNSGAGPSFTTTGSISTLSCSDGSNLAQGKSLSNISAQQSGNPASNIVDGSVSNRWSAEGFPQSVVIDLGGLYAVDQIRLYPYNDRAYQFLVEGSSSSASAGFSTMTDARNNTSGGSVISKSFSTAAVRYVKLTITGASGYSGVWSSVEEFEVICAGNSSQRNRGEGLQKGAEAVNILDHTQETLAYYPNPFKGELMVAIPTHTAFPSSIRLVDMLGREVYRKSNLKAGDVIQVTSSLQQKGVYLLQWVDQNNQIIQIHKVIQQ